MEGNARWGKRTFLHWLWKVSRIESCQWPDLLCFRPCRRWLSKSDLCHRTTPTKEAWSHRPKSRPSSFDGGHSTLQCQKLKIGSCNDHCGKVTYSGAVQFIYLFWKDSLQRRDFVPFNITCVSLISLPILKPFLFQSCPSKGLFISLNCSQRLTYCPQTKLAMIRSN